MAGNMSSFEHIKDGFELKNLRHTTTTAVLDAVDSAAASASAEVVHQQLAVCSAEMNSLRLASAQMSTTAARKLKQVIRGYKKSLDKIRKAHTQEAAQKRSKALASKLEAETQAYQVKEKATKTSR